ncbi:MAG: DNA repair protein RecN, partial [Candidatus Neomarinimicrobiota bacterium]
ETVGAALERLAEGRQLICITHLAQIAARGGHHIIMSKAVEQGRTFSRSEVLTAAGRRMEVARLLSGAEITEASREQARLLLAGRTAPEEVTSDG